MGKKQASEILKEYGIWDREAGLELDDRQTEALVADIIDASKRQGGYNYKGIVKGNNDIKNVGGNYYHMMYGKVLESGFEANYTIRFMLLSTFANYENILVQGNTKGQTLIKESDLQDILKLGRAEFFKTKNYLVENNLIIINEDGSIKINDEFCVKGSTNCNHSVTRVFESGFRDLYYGVKPVQHKNLFFFVRCLPYLNKEYNILCENPQERIKDYIKPLSFSELGSVLNLTKDQSKKLKTTLFKLRINNKKVIAEFVNLSDRRVVVNPAIFYQSNSGENMSDIAKIFETF